MALLIKNQSIKKRGKITKKKTTKDKGALQAKVGISNDSVIPKHASGQINLKTHKYTKYYPSILDPAFSQKIAKHNLFRKYKSTLNKSRLEDLYTAYETNKPSIEDSKKKESSVFISKTITKMLRNFMSPYSPYRSLLIYHEMGVGKTCTGITIAESLKHLTRNSNTKIYVIRPMEFERQLFNPNVVMDGEPLKQCTGDSYIQDPKLQPLVQGCMNKNQESCDQLKFKVDKEIRGYYKFAGFKMWASDVYKEINARTKNIDNKVEKDKKITEIIQKMFNNAVIIVDEAHELRDIILDEAHELRDISDRKALSDAKFITPILFRVLKYATNVRLIFMTATPIYDKPQNIISLINYFLLNDNRPMLKEADIFNKEGHLKPAGRELLIANTRGYVSFLRGSNPYEFPIRLSAKYNIPNNILNLEKYPRKNYLGNRLDKDDCIKYLELVDCPLGGEQLRMFKYHIKHDKLYDFDENTISDLSYSDISGDTPSDNTPSNEKLILDDDDAISIDEIISLEESIFGDGDGSRGSSASNISKKSSRGKSEAKKIRKSEPIKVSTVAYQFESQMSNIIYQSLEECNNNLKLAVGDQGLDQILTRQQGKWTYEFNDDKYARRFKLPELYNWGAKIARIIDIAIKSAGPVFIYTNFVNAGAKPIAIALEMNGFRRYKQHDIPLIENGLKDKTYRGDYILFTGDPTLSAYAKEYINKREAMVREKNVKVFIGTSVASEGLNLFGYREVHILDPWHNINLTEQSIGRVIRTGSHLHLPPQERNVSVYQYATTLDDRESFDLKIYKIGEKKAIKSGIVEKLLKENAIDCELNHDVNVFDEEHYHRKIPQITSRGVNIKISLADTPFSRSCFYMKECGYVCASRAISKSDKNQAILESSQPVQPTPPFPIMKFNYDKELEEYRNLIKQLVASSFNVNINHLRAYLRKLSNKEESTGKMTKKSKITKKGRETSKQPSKQERHQETIWDDEDAFLGAIQDIINTDTVITDKFGREGRIVLSGDILRFIPSGQLSPNISIIQQYLPVQNNPPIKSQVDLKGFISKLSEEQKRLAEEQELNYEDILHKLIEKAEQVYYGVYQKEYKYNIKIKLDEVLDLLFNKLNYTFKVLILKNILEKMVQNIRLSDDENKIKSSIQGNIVYMNEIFHDTRSRKGSDTMIQKETKDARDARDIENIYGFIIQNESKLELFILTDEKVFEKNQGNLRKIVEFRKNQMKLTPNNNLHGYLKYEKGIDIPVFKMVDIITKGEKKSVSGIKCITDSTTNIKKNLNKLDDKILRSKHINYNKNALCNDIEIILKRNDAEKLNKKKWFYTPEEYFIVFES